MSDMSSIISLMGNNPQLCYEIGDCPNVELTTMGGQFFWKTSQSKNGWKLQQNRITGLSRVLDGNDVRKAWGSPVIMQEKFKRLTRQEFLEPGDIIGVVRKKALNLYEHYAVYLGRGMVVHYSGGSKDFQGQICVRKDTLNTFWGTDKNYFVLFFDEDLLTPKKIQARTSFDINDTSLSIKLVLPAKRKMKLYSAKDTMDRALSRLGENKYNLIFNNCEHFAIWCKTGISESYQVEKVVGMLTGINHWT